MYLLAYSVLCLFIAFCLPSKAWPIDAAAASDFTDVQAEGVGITLESATQDALRTAIDKAAGLLISSQSLIDNYRLVRDIIATSSNGYCKKYEVLASDFIKEQSIYHVKIKATISTKLFNNAIKMRLPAHDTIDMTTISEIKNEMAGAKERAKSAALYTAQYVQSNYRNTFQFKFDTLAVKDKDVVSGRASLAFSYSFSWNSQVNLFANTLKSLLQRLDAFAASKYRYEVLFSPQYSLKRIDGKLIGLHKYDFFVETHLLTSGYWNEEAKRFERYSYSVRMSGSPGDCPTDKPIQYLLTPLNRSLCCFSGKPTDSTFMPYFFRLQYDDMPPLDCKKKEILNIRRMKPEYFRTATFNCADCYTNSFIISDDLKNVHKDMANVSIDILFLEIEGGRVVRNWRIVDMNRNVNLSEELLDY